MCSGVARKFCFVRGCSLIDALLQIITSLGGNFWNKIDLVAYAVWIITVGHWTFAKQNQLMTEKSIDNTQYNLLFTVLCDFEMYYTTIIMCSPQHKPSSYRKLPSSDSSITPTSSGSVELSLLESL